MEVVKTYTDTELVAALQSGTALNPVVKFLYKEYFEFLAIFIKQHQGTQQDAEDIFQEVMLNFIEIVRLNKFRGDSSVKTFLYALNRNAWFNELKRKGRADSRETKFEETKDKTDMDAAHFIAGRESKKQVLDIVDKLGDACKKILLAFYYENLSMKEILESSNYENEQVLRNKKYKCLKQLEQLLTANPNIAKTLKSALQYE